MSKAHTFPQFQRLPPELRTQIWSSFLQDAQPLVYNLCLRYSQRSEVRTGFSGTIPVRHYFPTSDDQIVLELAAYTRQYGLAYVSTQHRPNLVRATLCARAAALAHLPHSPTFRKLPYGWTSKEAHQADAADGSDYPEFTLRFHGDRDIFVFEAFWEDQEAVYKICEKQGRVPDAFTHMTRVGISVRTLWAGHAQHRPFGSTYGVSGEECDCSTAVCEDACRLDPLPKFVACFPALTTFYIARVSNGGCT